MSEKEGKSETDNKENEDGNEYQEGELLEIKDKLEDQAVRMN